MMKIVLKVSIMCDKCKTCIMKAATKLDGIKSIAIDEEKSTLTLICDTDVVQIMKELKKAGKDAQIVSVGPENEETEIENDVNRIECKPLPPCCNVCQPSYIMFYEEQPYGCIIS